MKGWLFSVSWDVATAKSKQLLPDLHKAMITGMCVTEKGDLITVSWDDHLRITPQAADSLPAVSCKLPSQPQGLAASSNGEVVVVACDKHLAVYTKGTLTEIPTEYNSSCVALSKDGRILAVGGQDSNVHMYKLIGKTLSEVKKISHSSPITAISFSDNEQFLVVTDQARKVTAIFGFFICQMSVCRSFLIRFSRTSSPCFPTPGLSTPPEWSVLPGLQTTPELPRVLWTLISSYGTSKNPRNSQLLSKVLWTCWISPLA